MNIFRLVHCVFRHSVYSTYSTRCEEVYAQDIEDEEKKTVLFCCPHKQPKLCPKNQLNNNKKRSMEPFVITDNRSQNCATDLPRNYVLSYNCRAKGEKG